MSSSQLLRSSLGAAMVGDGGAIGSADRLCGACVNLLGVDGAAISFVYQGATRGTFGSSGELSRRLDEFQFTFGEGPCLDAVSQEAPVQSADLTDADEQRWPAFAGAVLRTGVRAVFALPVSIAASPVGALDLFRNASGVLSDDAWSGATWAAELAALPLLELMSEEVDWTSAGDGADGWEQLESLERMEVYQATGMIQVQLDVGGTEALVRLRGYAFAHEMTASEVAWAVVERRLTFADEADGADADDGAAEGGAGGADEAGGAGDGGHGGPTP